MDHTGPIAPKKRVNGKKSLSSVSNVDHIIAVQRSNTTLVSGKNNLDEVAKNSIHNGAFHVGMNGIKSLKAQLPIITDEVDEDTFDSLADSENASLESDKPFNLHKNGYQPLSTNMGNSKEILDLSPIYENSSDACSSHDDLREAIDEQTAHKTFKIFMDESSTPNSLSQTHSESSLEMGLLSDHSAKNSAKRPRKRVNIVSDNEEADQVLETEMTVITCPIDEAQGPGAATTDDYLTMTGTIKRGKKKGQNIDVKLNISREELEVLEAAIVAKETNKLSILSQCTPVSGFHIFIFSVLCSPLIFFISGTYSFYIGTITWYNVFTYITEELTVWKKIILTPVIVIIFPFMILLFTVGLGCYAAITQFAFNFNTWWKEVCDLEKGFYGWLCAVFNLSDCSPYEVVILTDLKAVNQLMSK